MNLSELYKNIRCPKCKHRLKEPFELKCTHIICRDCLSTILKNHRTDARCPTCNKPLEEYQIECYSYLPVKHPVSKLLSSFTDVNQCETCEEFTSVEACIKCHKDQCDDCREKHEETHNKPKNEPLKQDFNELSKEEIDIVESIRKDLSEQEFEDFVTVAKKCLNSVIVKSNEKEIEFKATTIDSQQISIPVEKSIYDWSKHPRFTADDISQSKPERVRELLRLNFTPRPYQLRMIRMALRKQNSLVCLQTGAGKTFVAGLVAKFFHVLSLLDNNSESTRRFKAVFLVPIRALVDQQYEAFRKVFIDQSEAILKKIENQSGEKFKDSYEISDIFFLTVQKFVNFIDSKCTSLDKFDLIIIDECHHCYDNHPVNSMMQYYHTLKSSGSEVPQIIALTGSVGTGSKPTAFDHLVHLCANLDCFNVGAIEPGLEEDELRQSTNTPLADTIVTIDKQEEDAIINYIKSDVMHSIGSRLGFDISKMDNQHLDNYLSENFKTAVSQNDHDATVGIDYLRKLNRFLYFYDDLPLNHCMEWLEEQLKTSMTSNPKSFDSFCQQKINEFRQFAKQQMSCSSSIKEKLSKLISLIISLHTSSSRGLVLVRTKFHAFALKKFLNEQNEIKKNEIIVDVLTGQGPADQLCLPGILQATVLKQFRQGITNLLVATDVAQEGIDVAECSYVIRYEFVSNEIGAVQSRGRARAAQSKCFFLTESASFNLKREEENRQRELEMKRALNEWRKKGPYEFAELVREDQKRIYHNIQSGSSAETVSFSDNPKHTAQKIHCRYCNSYLCAGTSLRYQGSTVICVDPDFEARVKPPQTNGSKIICPEATCQREIGNVILLQRSQPGYVLQITALKFYYLGMIEPRIFKKWSLYNGDIAQM